jgi:hypothetical protein
MFEKAYDLVGIEVCDYWRVIDDICLGCYEWIT